MRKELLKLLACPRCKGELEYRKRTRELVCSRDRLAFPVRDSVPVLLLSDARPLDSGER